jgi:hypothetical protein
MKTVIRMKRLAYRLLGFFGIRRRIAPDCWRFPVIERVIVLDDPDELGLPTLSGPIMVGQGIRSLCVPYVRSGPTFGQIEYADTGSRVDGCRAFRMTPDSRFRYCSDMREVARVERGFSLA